MEYSILEKPLTNQQVDDLQGHINVVVAVPFTDVVYHNYEGLLDLMEEQAIEPEAGILVNITTDKLIGAKDGIAHINLIADVEETN